MDLLIKLTEYSNEGKLPHKFVRIIHDFFTSYKNAALGKGCDPQEFLPILDEYLELVVKYIVEPYPFQPFHERVTTPVDCYRLGLNLLRPLIIFESAKVLGLNHVAQMEKQLKQKENVVLFANHQTEPDPQVISLLLEKTYPKLAEEMIFVAGARVITDPLAVPISMGRNLLCIYSKKRIDHPPEEKEQKQLHNQRTMKRMSQLLAEGGKCIYVAPSGGRDRPDSSGNIAVAPFDPQSIEMFWLMAQQSGHPTHFYPLALSSYHLLPPPHSIDHDLGEARQATAVPVHLAFGEEIAMTSYPGCEHEDRKIRRQLRTDYIWNLVNKLYEQL